MVGPPYTGHFRVTADTPKGLVPMQPAVPSAASTEISGGSVAAKPSIEIEGTIKPSMEARQDIYSVKAPTKPVLCTSCGSDCTLIRYRNVKTKDADLCAGCFSEGRFLASMSSSDFIKVNLSDQTRGDDEGWTEEETLLLLEGLEMFDEDWSKISEHVGTRTKEQCIIKFLQLPIEDPFLEADIKSLGPLQYNRIPFNQTDNPVMSVVAFLASVVNPGVASAAAKAALRELGVDISQSKKDSNTMDTDSGEKISNAGIQKAASTALGAAAAKSKVLADYEDREIQRLVNAVVEAQLRKVELKMTQFEELEQILEYEKKEVERQRQQLFLDRLTLQKAMSKLDDAVLRELHSTTKFDDKQAGTTSAEDVAEADKQFATL